MSNLDLRRLIIQLSPSDLELFCMEWAETKQSQYHSLKRYAGTGDNGRDVVGYYSEYRQEGEWDNYQCKQYQTPLGTGEGVLELGKIFSYSCERNIRPPKNYYFVAPKGLNRNLQNAIDKPSELKNMLLDKWDQYCKPVLNVSLDGELKKIIENYDFSNVQVIDIDNIVTNGDAKAVLYKWFDVALPAPPQAVVPDEIEEKEQVYINKLLEVYSEQKNVKYQYVHEVEGDVSISLEIYEHRENFFCTEVFSNFYRDITAKDILSDFEREIYKGVSPIYRNIGDHKSSYDRLCKVLSQAANISPSGKLSIHAKIEVKQGYCHHFINKGIFPSWKF
ncbi:ABC-three component system protein [Vibrio vulnificus]|uniref:ABC-three component system protein n=1 Tax=Vibrio vulnificus TaxID=672 RepID=UPI003133ACAF